MPKGIITRSISERSWPCIEACLYHPFITLTVGWDFGSFVYQEEFCQYRPSEFLRRARNTRCASVPHPSARASKKRGCHRTTLLEEVIDRTPSVTVSPQSQSFISGNSQLCNGEREIMAEELKQIHVKIIDGERHYVLPDVNGREPTRWNKDLEIEIKEASKKEAAKQLLLPRSE